MDRQKLMRWAWQLAFVIAILWTGFHLSGLTQITHHLNELPWLLASLVTFEICFNLGLVMMAMGIGRKVSIADGKSLRSFSSAISGLRRSIRDLLTVDTTSRLYRRGLQVNWLGAVMTTGVIPLVAIVILLPARNWAGLMVLPILDLIATCVIRIPLTPKQRVN